MAVEVKKQNAFASAFNEIKKSPGALIAVIVVIGVILYIIYKSNPGNMAQTSNLSGNTVTQPSPYNGYNYGYWFTGGERNTEDNDQPKPNPQPAPNPVPTPNPGQYPVPTPEPTPVTPQPQSQRTVKVEKWPSQNSTLWGIAKTEYGDGSQWPKIYNANKDKIGNNPNLIYAGTTLVIP